jgi:Predicted dinucleotide-utilizing enzyme
MKAKNFICGIVFGSVTGAALGFGISTKLSNKIIEKKDIRTDKFVGYFNLLDQWMALKEEGKSFASYFEKNGYSKIAVYGLGKIGNHLLKELENTDIQILYAIDSKGEELNSNIEVYTLDDEIPEADVIVVTATFDYESIKEKLEEKVDIQIVSIDDVVYDLL